MPSIRDHNFCGERAMLYNFSHGSQLIDEITSYPVSKGKGVIWWLGQQSYILKLGSTILYLDLFLSDKGKRLIPPFFKTNEVINADLFLGTHLHRDHIDISMWPELSVASAQANFLVPTAVREKVIEQSHITSDRVLSMNGYESITFDNKKDPTDFPILIHAIPSAHEFLDITLEGFYPYLGYIIQYGQISLYHPGDTCIYPGLIENLKKFNPNIALLPINGRDAKRFSTGTIGNMTYQEACDLAGELRPRLTIPGHYDMMPGNLEDPQLFLDYMKAKYPQLKTMIARYCQPIEID